MSKKLGTVRVDVNKKNLVRNLGAVYSNTNVVLSELLQNARRAGATKVEVNHSDSMASLQVLDDGCGISDFQKLLMIAESGWNQEVVDAEQPYGMGWMATCFAAERVIVESKGKRMRFKTEDALALQDLECEESEVSGHTVITLLGCKLGNVDVKLRELVQGFPIPVTYNGAELPRPYALDGGLPFRATPIGQACVPALCGQVKYPSTSCRVFLQGLPVHTERYSRHDLQNIVHLDSQLFAARMPDRYQLLDAEHQEWLIDRAMQDHVRAVLKDLAASLPAAGFLERYYPMLLQWGAREILNDVPLLPQGVLTVFDEYPVLKGDGSNKNFYEGEPVSRAQVESGAVRLYACQDLDEENVLACMYAWKRGLLLVSTGVFDQAHWVHAYVTDLESMQFDLETVKPGATTTIHVGSSDSMCTCESYVVHCTDGAAKFDDAAIYHPDGKFYVPAGCKDAGVLGQADTFCDGDEVYREEWERDAVRQFRALLAMLRGGNAAKTMALVLEDCRFGDYPNIVGTTFLVSVSTRGRIKVTLASNAE